MKTAESLLQDLTGIDVFMNSAMDLLDDLRAYKSQVFDDWCERVFAALQDDDEDGGLLLETTGRLMDFERKDGKLRVSTTWHKLLRMSIPG